MTDLSPLFARPGANDMAWEHPAIPGRALNLRTARPAAWTPDTPVLFVHHGVLRNGGDYRDFWLPLVDEADLLVVVPEFTTEGFPLSPWYNFGNRETPEGVPKPRAEWTYTTDGVLFDLLRAQGLTRRTQYGVWGHSAGGQFVHRAMSLGFRDRVKAAVTANAGTYAMPDLAIDFPYGLGGTGVDTPALRALLGFRLTVMAGTEDVITDDAHFPKEPAAMAQGETRYARAHRYIANARKQAAAFGMRCAWTIIDVPGVNHDGQRMSVAAAPILSAALHA
jgi:poly(3-hydroxybutyrate) depolymerase